MESTKCNSNNNRKQQKKLWREKKTTENFSFTRDINCLGYELETYLGLGLWWLILCRMLFSVFFFLFYLSYEFSTFSIWNIFRLRSPPTEFLWCCNLVDIFFCIRISCNLPRCDARWFVWRQMTNCRVSFQHMHRDRVEE